MSTEFGHGSGRKERGTSPAVHGFSFSAIEKAMLYSSGADQLQQIPITARWTSILDAGTSRLRSALLDVHVADDGLLPDLDDAEECFCRRCRSDRRATERLVSCATRC